MIRLFFRSKVRIQKHGLWRLSRDLTFTDDEITYEFPLNPCADLSNKILDVSFMREEGNAIDSATGWNIPARAIRIRSFVPGTNGWKTPLIGLYPLSRERSLYEYRLYRPLISAWSVKKPYFFIIPENISWPHCGYWLYYVHMQTTRNGNGETR